jgi:hypothetical protein
LSVYVAPGSVLKPLTSLAPLKLAARLESRTRTTWPAGRSPSDVPV